MNKLCCLLLVVVMSAGCNFPVEITSRSVVRVTSAGGQSQGTGFVVAKLNDSYIVFTAAHVLSGPGGPGCWKIDGYDVVAGMIEPFADIAILVFKPDWPYKPLGFGNPTRGQHARLIGYPGRMAGALSQTNGHIMAISKNVLVNDIWYDGGAIPGFSGGPIVDDWGRVLGMAKSHVLGKYTGPGGEQWMCYDTALCCTPAETLRNILRNMTQAYLPPESLIK